MFKIWDREKVHVCVSPPPSLILIEIDGGIIEKVGNLHTHTHTLTHTLTHTQHKMSLRLAPPLHLKSLPLPLWLSLFPSSFLFYILFCFLSFSFSFFLNISYWFYFLRFMYVYFILFLFNLKQKCHGMLDLLFCIKTFFLGLV